MIPISKGMVTYKEVFLDKIYGIEDLDILWQLINFNNVSETWDAILAEDKSK